MAFLEIKNISKSFEGKSVLNNVNISVKKGDFVSLLGKSGCGKTTLLRIIAGLELPDSGQIFLNGTEITSNPVQSRNIGFVFQNYALFPHMNIFENIAYGLKIKKLTAGVINKKVEDIMDKVGLSSKKNTNVSLLSGGEQQRIAFARAIVTEPEIILLDEPLSNLDFSLRIQARNELKRLQNETGITSIYVTHDQSEALALSDYISVMDGGKIMQSGAPKEIYYQPENRFAAEFVGRYNLFNSLESFRLFGETIPENKCIGILPEHLIMERGTEDTGTSIKDVLFTGTLTECLLVFENRFLKSVAITNVSNKYFVGEHVKLSVSKEHIKIIPS